MLPVKDLGSDSPLYFSLLEHPCTHDLKLIASPVVTLALWSRAQSRCPQTNHRPCVSRLRPEPAQTLPRNAARLSAHHWQANRHAHGYKYAGRFGNSSFVPTDNWRIEPYIAAHICAATLKSIPASWRRLCCRLNQRPMRSLRSIGCSHRDRFKCGTRRKECTSGLSLSGVPVRGQ